MIHFESIEEVRKGIRMMILQPPYNEYLLDLRIEEIPNNTYCRQNVLNGRNLYQFIKNFVENKAGNITPKSMVIQHFILESLFEKCHLSDRNSLLFVSISNYMNVQHRLKIEENLKSLPF